MAEAGFVSEWFDIPEEIIAELFSDFDEEESHVETVPVQNASTGTVSQFTEISMIWRRLKEQYSVETSEKGEELLKGWVCVYQENHDKGELARWYTQFSSQKAPLSHDFVGMHTADVANFLLDVIENIISPEKKQCPTQSSASVSRRESDIIEYIAGYVLFKAAKKFPGYSLLQHLTAETPTGSLITLMEKKTGGLKYPSLDFTYLLQRMYFDISKEASKCPSKINFDDASKTIMSAAYYSNFLAKLNSNSCVGEYHKAMNYMAQLYIRVLTFSITRKLCEKLQRKPSKGAQSLRGSLRK